MRNQLILAVSAAACLLLAGCSSSNESKKAEEKQPAPSASTPEAKKEPAPTPPAAEPTKAPEPKKEEPKKTAGAAALPAKAPDVFKVNMETSKGLIVMECHKAWAPNGVNHFYDLLKLHFFDDVRFFRVIPGFMAQFGINGTPSLDATWANANIPDDHSPTRQHNTRGMVSYGQTSMPNSRSTQLFINYGDNSRLDADGFPPICLVTSGMEAAEQIYPGYGERPDQGLMHAQGNAYLNTQFPRLDYIKKATIVLQ